MLAGALAATLGATRRRARGPGSRWRSWPACCSPAVFAAVAIGARADQIIAGTAHHARRRWGSPGRSTARRTAPAARASRCRRSRRSPIPGLSRIPVLGPALFDQPAPTYLALLALPVVWWVLFRTRAGLTLRATGEGAAMARAAGVRTERWSARRPRIVGGGFAGLAGATLVLAQVGTFAEKMTAGRGFVAIAIVVLGRWHPLGVAVAALLFGAATALQYVFQSLGLAVPYQLFLMLPYVLTLLALAGAVGRVRAPADLGKR